MGINRFDIREGMTVRSTRGERLGKIIACGRETFVIEKGIFFPKDHELRVEYVSEIRDGEVMYAFDEASRATTSAAANPATSTKRGEVAPEPMPKASSKTKETERMEPETHDYRIPLMEERLGVEKYVREAGKVRVHKKVVTEEKKVTVPLKHEEVLIERVAASPGDVARSEAAFREETIDVPLMEEEIRLTKRPVLREEVRLHKVAREEQRVASGNIRHEEAEIEDTSRHSTTSEAERRAEGEYDKEPRKL
jgi:uncharacterized protein (TIGR02271 family)